MIKISNNLKAVLNKGSANAFIKIKCGNFVFGYNENTADDDNKILELSINRSASFDDYPLGNAYSCYVNAVLWDIPSNAVLKGQKTSVHAGYMVDGAVEWIPLGVYYPEKPSRSGQCLSFTAYDKMYSLSFAYIPKISGSQTPIAILEDLARAGSFELDESVYTVAAGEWDNISMSLLYGQENDEAEITSFSVSDCISYIAGYIGANAMFNRDGKLAMYRFTDAVDENGIKYTVDDDCVNNVSVDESDSRVEYITCNNGTEKITSSSKQLSVSAKGVLINNPLIRTQSQLDKIKDTIFMNGVFSYRAVSLCHMCGNPALDCYDVIMYKDSDGNSYNFPLMSVEMIYDGSIVCNLQSFSKSADEQNQTGVILNRLIASSVSKQTQHLSERISQATKSIATAVGGLVALVDTDGDGVPDNIIAGEHQVDLAAGSKWRTQGKCIRINQNGIAVSTTGADGPFTDFAVYYDETNNKYYLNADDIAAGTLKGIKIIADDANITGNINAISGKIGTWDISDGGLSKIIKKHEILIGADTVDYDVCGSVVSNSPSAFVREPIWWIGRSGDGGFRDITFTNEAGIRVYHNLDLYMYSNLNKGTYFIGNESTAGQVCDTYIRGASVRIYNHSGGGVYLGLSGSTIITSDEKLKELSDIDSRYEEFFYNLEPLLYTYKQNGHRKHIGFGARKVKESLENSNLTTEEFAGVVIQKDITIYADENGTNQDIKYDELYSLRYEEFIALNTYMIQKQQKQIEAQQEEINELKAQIADILQRLEGIA